MPYGPSPTPGPGTGQFQRVWSLPGAGNGRIMPSETIIFGSKWHSEPTKRTFKLSAENQ